MKRWVTSLMLLGTGCGIGSCMAQGPPPEDPRPIIKTKYVDRPVEKRVTVKEYKIPGDCGDALDWAVKLKSEAGELVGVTTTAQDILADGHEALTMSDGSRVNEQRDKLYKLEVKTNAVNQDISLETVPKLDRALRLCKATNAYKGSK